MSIEQFFSKIRQWNAMNGFALGFLAWKASDLYRSRFWFRWGVRTFAGAALLLTAGIVVAGSVLIYDTSKCDLAKVGDFGRNVTVLDSEDRLIGAIGANGRVLLRRKDIPDSFVVSLLAAEDNRFYEHSGFDAVGILRATWMNVKKLEVDQGGSSITQQLARNTFPLGGRTLRRKALELLVALQIERKFTKDQIIEHYANRIYFGSGFYGLGAAANGYFGKPAKELTLSESAMLAGLIRSPNYLSPFNNPEASIGSMERVLARVADEGWISEEQHQWSRQKPVVLVNESGHRGHPIYLLNRIEEEVKQTMGEKSLLFGTIKTSINLDFQRASEVALRNGIASVNRSENKTGIRRAGIAHKEASRRPGQLQGASLVVEQSTGRIVCAVPSRDQVESHYDRIRLSKRPPGFAFAPLVFAAAFDSGVTTPQTPVFDLPLDNRLVMLGGTSGILGEWSTGSRINRYLGQIPSGLALVAGKQSATARIGFEVGLERLGAVAESMGIRSSLNPFPSTYLGASGISLEELTHAYTSIANFGTRVRELTLVDAILDREGTPLFRRNATDREEVNAISPETSQRLRRLLYEALDERLDDNEYPRSAKPDEFGITGTSHNFEDNWAVGANGAYTWGVWLGFDKPGRIHGDASARETALPVWMEMAETFVTGESANHEVAQQSQKIVLPVAEPIRNEPNDLQPEPKSRHPRIIPTVLPVEGEDAWLALGRKSVKKGS